MPERSLCRRYGRSALRCPSRTDPGAHVDLAGRLGLVPLGRLKRCANGGCVNSLSARVLKRNNDAIPACWLGRRCRGIRDDNMGALLPPAGRLPDRACVFGQPAGAGLSPPKGFCGPVMGCQPVADAAPNVKGAAPGIQYCSVHVRLSGVYDGDGEAGAGAADDGLVVPPVDGLVSHMVPVVPSGSSGWDLA